MQNKFDRQKIRICSELWGEVFLIRGRTVVYINVVGYKAMAAFDSWKENRFFQLFSSSGRLSFRLLHSEIRPFLPSRHYPRLVRTAWKSITVKPNRISFSALKQIFNLRSSRQTRQACRKFPRCALAESCSFLSAFLGYCSTLQQSAALQWWMTETVGSIFSL